MSDFDDFVSCCRTEGNLDLEALDVAVLEPIQDIVAWWLKQPVKMHVLFDSLATAGVKAAKDGPFAKALEAFLTKTLKIPAAGVSGLIATMVIAVAGGITIAALMQILSVCSIRVLGSP